MAETISCPSSNDPCSCGCNCQAFLAGGRSITVGDLVIDGNQYTFSYTISNQDPEVSFVIFCIQCPTNTFEASSANTTITVVGNPGAVSFTQCSPPGCESSGPNRFSVEFDFGDEEECCFYQGIKININPGDTITEFTINLRFTLPEGVAFTFTPGPLKLKAGQNIDIVNCLCLPGCIEGCDLHQIVCEMWKIENKLLESKKDVFSHLGQLILPQSLNLNTITTEELENKIRNLNTLEKSIARLDCCTAKVLKALKNLKICDDCDCCI